MGSAAVWSISEKEKPDRASVDRLGNEFLIGNGFVGLRGALDEYGPAEKVACIPTGIYDQRPGKWREPVNLPNALFVRVSVGKKILHAIDTATESHEQRLDFRHGVLSRETVFLPDDADPTMHVTVRSSRFASMRHPHLLCCKYSIVGPHLGAYRDELSDDACGLFSSTLEKEIPVVAAVVIAGGGRAAPDVRADRHAYKRRVHRLEAGREVTFCLFAYVGYG